MPRVARPSAASRPAPLPTGGAVAVEPDYCVRPSAPAASPRRLRGGASGPVAQLARAAVSPFAGRDVAESKTPVETGFRVVRITGDGARTRQPPARSSAAHHPPLQAAACSGPSCLASPG